MRGAIRRRNVLLEDLKLGVRYPRGQIGETQSSRTIRICTSDLPCISLPLFEPAGEWPAFPLRFMTVQPERLLLPACLFRHGTARGSHALGLLGDLHDRYEHLQLRMAACIRRAQAA
ncbi:conserved hypothetical protein [Histoplasma capsulatum var. duboisii H88]|uniref:Uncharacterized protein n=1 Tax=Ajellomyces capsulatus (strain H88) TaxID=544711 RepID=F0UL98_AJEC8|nr:conserved hypothetical protein [Histoplasma capsulatum var. duboisii H88]